MDEPEPRRPGRGQKRGEELAASWLKGWQDEVDKNGGDVWMTMGAKLDAW